MEVLTHLKLLQRQLSAQAAIVSDNSDHEFQTLLKRWSDTDVKVPAAVILPATEADCQISVSWTRTYNVPFVLKCGGHSPWSSISSPGVVIDLARFSGVTVDTTAATATIVGSVLSNQIVHQLAGTGVFTAIGNGNSVGAIPYFVGGGNNPFLPLTGYASDNILAARIVTANGDLIEADCTRHKDLLWAIRGAGQFFGLITSLTIRTYSLSILGSPGHKLWSGIFVFPIDRAEELARTMKPLMEDETYSTFGLIMISAPPPAFKPAIVVVAKLFGSPADAPKAYHSLYELKPVMTKADELNVENLNDSLDHVCAKGELKRYTLAGAHHFAVENFLETVALWQQLVSDCPDAIKSSFNFHWHSRPPRTPASDSAMSHQDIRMWQSVLLWYKDEGSTEKVMRVSDEVIAAMRIGQSVDQYVDFQNSVRDAPIERRYRGPERLAKLRQLKRLWDPEGMFTEQLL